MRVSELMTQEVLTVREWEELGLSSDLIRFRSFRHLPVVSAEGKLVGILSRTDLVARSCGEKPPRTIPVHEAMERDPHTIHLEATAGEAAEKMRTNQIHSLPVVDDAGMLLGILTDSDILKALAGRELQAEGAPQQAMAEVMVSAVMTPDPKTVDADSDVEEAAGALLEGNFRHLPVLDANLRLTGMISERDLRAALGANLSDWGAMDTQRLEEVISNVMVPEPVFVREYNRLVDVLDVFTDERIGAVPVLDANDVLVGILSYVDVLKWLRNLAKQEGLGPARGAQQVESIH